MLMQASLGVPVPCQVVTQVTIFLSHQVRCPEWAGWRTFLVVFTEEVACMGWKGDSIHLRGPKEMTAVWTDLKMRACCCQYFLGQPLEGINNLTLIVNGLNSRFLVCQGRSVWLDSQHRLTGGWRQPLEDSALRIVQSCRTPGRLHFSRSEWFLS